MFRQVSAPSRMVDLRAKVRLPCLSPECTAAAGPTLRFVHPARYPMGCATCMRWRLKIGRVVATDGRIRVWLGRQRESCTQQPLAAVGLPLSTHMGLLLSA